MENDNRETIYNEDNNTFGPHSIEEIVYGEVNTLHFFTLSYKDQDVSKNKMFIKWKKDMKKVNDIIVHCPFCSAYFPHEAMDYCRCAKCRHRFCFGCKQRDCKETRCFKWWKVIVLFYGIKGYGDSNFFMIILMYLFMVIQTLFTFPLQILYKFGPFVLGEYGPCNYEEYKIFTKKGLLLSLTMIPYQIAFIGMWFDITFILFFLPTIIYPPYSFYSMGCLRFMQYHYHGQIYFEDNGKFIKPGKAQ